MYIKYAYCSYIYLLSLSFISIVAVPPSSASTPNGNAASIILILNVSSFSNSRSSVIVMLASGDAQVDPAWNV